MFRCGRRQHFFLTTILDSKQTSQTKINVNSSDVILRDFMRITAHVFHTTLSKCQKHCFVFCKQLYTHISSLDSSGPLSGRDLFGLTGVRRLGGGGAGDELRRGNRKAAGRYECRVSAGEQWNALVT